NLIVEFRSANALVAMTPLLPYKHQSKKHYELHIIVKSLATECSAAAGVAEPEEYITQLRKMARRSGRNFEDILRNLMGHIKSLLSPAADVVKGLGPNTIPSMYLRVLDSAFATVQDGEELFAQFLNTLQDQGEKASAYLQRLQLALTTVVKRGGVSVPDFNKHLLKQFCRGCWDNAVINKLQLEQLMGNPPSFAEFLLLLRTEEDRQLAKESLMKRHLTSTKQRAHVHSQSTCACGSDNNVIIELKKEMQKLQAQMSALLSQKTRSFKPVSSPPKPPTPKPNAGGNTSRPRPGYCFSCGEEGHMSAGCTSPPNPSLVQQKNDTCNSDGRRGMLTTTRHQTRGSLWMGTDRGCI
uniref:CCHC-type domain-containing protein n=1 Tax=Neogobius melanostomus TaxID=47308 RepID=A0A8C6SRY2_9GOBI